MNVIAWIIISSAFIFGLIKAESGEFSDLDTMIVLLVAKTADKNGVCFTQEDEDLCYEILKMFGSSYKICLDFLIMYTNGFLSDTTRVQQQLRIEFVKMFINTSSLLSNYVPKMMSNRDISLRCKSLKMSIIMFFVAAVVCALDVSGEYKIFQSDKTKVHDLPSADNSMGFLQFNGAKRRMPIE